VNEPAVQRADRALRQWVRIGRTIVDVGAELDHLRHQRDLSADDLARRTTMPTDTIRAIESGSRWPTTEEFERLANGLGLRPNQLAELLRPVLAYQAEGIGPFQACCESDS
jgi:transcriptional regulator with XRE-family HTH domain